MLTQKTLKKNLWIKDSSNRLGKIIHIHSSISGHLGSTPFVYQVHKGCRAYAEIGKDSTGVYHSIPTPVAFVWKHSKNLINFFRS